MNLFLPALLALAVFFAALWLTGRFRRYGLARRLLDIPNERSSHTRPTPRVGGVAIVLTTLTALPLLAAMGSLTWSTVWGLLGGTGLVALIGFADDNGHIPPHFR